MVLKIGKVYRSARNRKNTRSIVELVYNDHTNCDDVHYVSASGRVGCCTEKNFNLWLRSKTY